MLPIAEPDAAARKLERAVKYLGPVGALVDPHTAQGKSYKGPEHDAFWATAEKLGIPIYLHPTWPSSNTSLLYQENFSESAATSLGSSAFGWHSETGLHFLRLYAPGLFHRRLGLKIILGHVGEMILSMLGRTGVLSKRWGTFDRSFKEVWDENVCHHLGDLVFRSDDLHAELGEYKDGKDSV